MKKSVLISIALVVFALWLGAPMVGLYFFGSWVERGQFGDLFGSVNALFSGLAFAGLIYAIFLQGQQLSLQREELRLQREEMAASRKELARQADVQTALVRATVAQIKVVAEQVRVEAMKMSPGNVESPVAHARRIAGFERSATHIDEIAASVEADQGPASRKS